MVILLLGIATNTIWHPIAFLLIFIAFCCAFLPRPLAWFLGATLAGFSLRAGAYRIFMESEGYLFSLELVLLNGMIMVAAMTLAFGLGALALKLVWAILESR